MKTIQEMKAELYLEIKSAKRFDAVSGEPYEVYIYENHTEKSLDEIKKIIDKKVNEKYRSERVSEIFKYKCAFGDIEWDVEDWEYPEGYYTILDELDLDIMKSRFSNWRGREKNFKIGDKIVLDYQTIPSGCGCCPDDYGYVAEHLETIINNLKNAEAILEDALNSTQVTIEDLEEGLYWWETT